MTTVLPAEIAHRTSMLNQRATSLRAQADGLPEIQALTYRRRAAELELEAWALEVSAGVLVPVAA